MISLLKNAAVKNEQTCDNSTLTRSATCARARRVFWVSPSIRDAKLGPIVQCFSGLYRDHTCTSLVSWESVHEPLHALTRVCTHLHELPAFVLQLMQFRCRQIPLNPPVRQHVAHFYQGQTITEAALRWSQTSKLLFGTGSSSRLIKHCRVFSNSPRCSSPEKGRADISAKLQWPVPSPAAVGMGIMTPPGDRTGP